MMTAAVEPQPIRITRLSFEDPSSLLPHPSNPKIHPKIQQTVLRSLLKEVGWVSAIVVNDLSGYILDGHDRAENAISEGQSLVPVLHVEVPLEQEPTVLLTFDQVGRMAVIDRDATRRLLEDLPPVIDDKLAAFLAGQGAALADLPPPRPDLGLETIVSCPACGHQFAVVRR